jgi:hypothetical protein
MHWTTKSRQAKLRATSVFKKRSEEGQEETRGGKGSRGKSEISTA